ncbi:DUF1657 domain-containing protein [Aquibacillus halophilus]|uniref:DUF1657 domain-containing protein n=1 Tax=Aquibacillus halophilus TaxID=930132 RepID=A0A6A8D8D5_9BACI|nr:DUF1657 domain-containing protein [Aquibacillus halophilus]MRH41848.1 DUF1657 domain-containing protein [Aquibacillus halophilus]
MTVASQVKQSLSSIKSLQSSFSSLAIRTQSEEAKRVFHDTMIVMDEVKNDLQKRVGEMEREEEQYKGF